MNRYLRSESEVRQKEAAALWLSGQLQNLETGYVGGFFKLEKTHKTVFPLNLQKEFRSTRKQVDFKMFFLLFCFSFVHLLFY